MSSFAEHSRPGRWLPFASACLLFGCYQSHECVTTESCNYFDDDCDGNIDEGFVDEDGEYRLVEHCGACTVDCAVAFPTADMVGCEDDVEVGPICVLRSCPPGFHPAGEGACTVDVPVLCLPCETDDDCALRVPGAQCREDGSEQLRCTQPCGAGVPCPEGFACDIDQCVPDSGWCGCSDLTEEAELACLLRVEEDGRACVGVRRCGPSGPGECEPALAEACNEADDDCDGEIDEDFRDEEGRYIDRLHCGACATPCVEPGPNMVATCEPAGVSVTCEVACLEGFVDVDGIAANGCECERFDGVGPPPAIGGDADCDGVPDDTDIFVFVTPTGNDANPGTLIAPMRTLNAALARGDAVGRDVLVARGVYEGPLDMVSGVSIFGGYSPDFRDRNLELFPVIVERPSAEAGLPALLCDSITEDTRVEGFTIVGRDATGTGEGSTAVYVDGCGPLVRFASLEILAGRGSDGIDGLDSSERLVEFGYDSLSDLDGVNGGNGGPGNPVGTSCTVVDGGSGGAHSCAGGVMISGGDGGDAACPETGCFNGSPCGNAGCTDFTVGDECDFEAVLEAATPNPAPEPGLGPSPGSRAVLTYNAPTNRTVCNFCDDNPTLPRDSAHGGDGAPGTDASGGTGCASAPVLGGDGRITGGAGTAGTAGQNGSGGGGASAGAGYDVIGGTDGGCEDRSGGSGGGGGSGGCGAPGAGAGSGGGTSVGIVIRLTTINGPVFEDVRVVTASGGRGGDGGVGADGGRGGAGGSGGVGRFWCARTGGRGGDGGRGGAGGGGGGGCGGSTHGIYLAPVGVDGDSYAETLRTALIVEEAGIAGRGGRGGFSPGFTGGEGADGRSDPVFVSP